MLGNNSLVSFTLRFLKEGEFEEYERVLFKKVLLSTVDPRIETLMFCSSVNGKKNLVWSLFALVCGSCMAWTSIKTLLFCVTLENKKLTYQILLINHLSILECYNYFFKIWMITSFPLWVMGCRSLKIMEALRTQESCCGHPYSPWVHTSLQIYIFSNINFVSPIQAHTAYCLINNRAGKMDLKWRTLAVLAED